jgi:hypothetical protein
MIQHELFPNSTIEGTMTEIYKRYRQYADMDPRYLANYKADPGIDGYIELLRIICAAQKRGEEDNFNYEAAAMEVLPKNAPKILTPLQYKKITGFPWPGNAKMYHRHYHKAQLDKDSFWTPWITSYHYQFKDMYCDPFTGVVFLSDRVIVVCATTIDYPPDEWRPEETT